MAGETTLTIVGNLVAPPEFRFTPSGVAVANFTVASTPRKFNKQTNEWEDQPALFMRCNAWREIAENVAESLTEKGIRVIVTGQLAQRSYEKDGQKHTVIELKVEEIGPSLRYARAKPVRRQQGQGGQQGGYQQQPPPQQGYQQQPPPQQGGQYGGQQQDPWGGAPQGGYQQQGGPEDPPF